MEKKLSDIIQLSGFTRKQKAALRKPPPQAQIRKRHDGERELTYLEGWYVIAEANRIFGAELWDRVTLTTQCVWQGKSDGQPSCAYTARVRICVRAGAYTLVREGSGMGQGRGRDQGEAHGNALKAAETDATKRALATLGAPFGLTLYERDAPASESENPEESLSKNARSRPNNVSNCTSSERFDKVSGQHNGNARQAWMLVDATGQVIAGFHDPVLCCSKLRKSIESTHSTSELEALFAANRRLLTKLTLEKPELRSDSDQHYAAILTSLYQARLKRLAQPTPSDEATPQLIGSPGYVRKLAGQI